MSNFSPKVKRSTKESVSIKLQRGDNLLRAQRFHEALDLFAEIIATDADITKAHIYAGQASLCLKQYDEALEHARNAACLNPMDPKPLLLIGRVYEEQKKWSEALACFQDAVHLDPKSAVGYTGIGEVFYNLGNYNQAIEMFRKALDLDASYTKAYTSIAKAYISNQDQAGGVIRIDEDFLDFIERSSHLALLEEDNLWQMVGSSSQSEIEEQLTDLEYIHAWLKPLVDEIQWQINFLKRACDLPRSMIIPKGMEEDFESLSSSDNS